MRVIEKYKKQFPTSFSDFLESELSSNCKSDSDFEAFICLDQIKKWLVGKGYKFKKQTRKEERKILHGYKVSDNELTTLGTTSLYDNQNQVPALEKAIEIALNHLEKSMLENVSENMKNGQNS